MEPSVLSQASLCSSVPLLLRLNVGVPWDYILELLKCLCCGGIGRLAPHTMLPWCSKRTLHNSNTLHDCSTPRHFPDALSACLFVITLSPVSEFRKFPSKVLVVLKSSEPKTTNSGLSATLAKHLAGRSSSRRSKVLLIQSRNQER